jgi:hypothetical protein
MATSGTVGTTQLDVAQLLEHAARRVGKVSSTLTEEQTQIARDNLFLILTSMINRGINLWCIDKQVMAVYTDQIMYDLAPGTIDILNTFWRNISVLDVTWTVAAANWTGQIDGGAEPVVSIAFVPTTTQTLTLVLEGSEDGVAWENVKTLDADTYTAGLTYWYDVEPAPSFEYWRLRETVLGALALDSITLVNQNTEIEIGRINRDDYTNLPNKNSTGQPTQFWFDRQINPRIWIWPQPYTAVASIVYWRQRQVQDVGQLTNTLEIPTRWIESIVWQLAARLAFELPGIDPDRLKIVIAMADKYDMEVGSEEYDDSPIYLAPNISGYTQ